MTSNSRYKWLALTVFSFAAALSQALWLNFAPLISVIEQKYRVTEDQAGLLLLVFPLIYVLVSIPSGKFIDQKGYGKSLKLGSLVMALFSVLRIYDQNFWVLLLAQIGIALAQPLVINSISKLVLDLFPKDQEAMATGIGTMGMFLGMAVGMMITPYLVIGFGFQITMVVFAILTSLSCISCFLMIKKEVSSQNSKADLSLGFSSFMKDKNLVLIFILSFVGLGFFNGLTTWIEPILAPRGINSIQAGVIGGMLIIGGIFGAAIIPTLSDYFKKRKPFLIFSIVVATLTLWPLCHTSNFTALFLTSSAQGFFFLPAFSLLLQMCSEQVGQARAGTATSILMLLGNAGGVVVILAMEAIKTDAAFTNGVYLLQVLLIISVILAAKLLETFPNVS